MRTAAVALAWTQASAPESGGGAGLRALSLLLGSGFTLVLFWGIAHYEKAAPAEAPAALDDLRVSVLPVQPPPLPVKPPEMVAEALPMAGFELAPSNSPVKIAVSPPDLAALLPEDLSKAPPAEARLALRLTDFKPKMDYFNDTQHIYQHNEVDRAPTVLERPTKYVSDRVRDNAPQLRVTLLVVIDAYGAASQVRLARSSGNPPFDDLMIESIKEWVFTPALKGGRKVRCLIEQGITVRWSSTSRFQLD